MMDQFCKDCADIFRGKRKFGTAYPLQSRFREQPSASNCKLCEILSTPTSAKLSNLLEIPESEGTNEYVWSPHRMAREEVDLCQLTIRNNAKRSREIYRFDLIRKSMAPKKASHVSSWDNILEWIGHCDGQHQLCHSMSSSWMPTRVLDVSFDKVVKLEGNPSIERYATLSHCWGPNPSFFKLTRDSYARLRDGVQTVDLSRTFQDAISATQKLGLRYIWIDALTIIQDSAEDWLREAPQMAKIYSGSYINFAATDSFDSSGGFHRPRPRCNIDHLEVEIDWEGITKDTYFCFLHDPWDRYMKSLSIMSRAWIFQERMLSRTVHFGADQLLWECNELASSEVFPAGSPFMSQEYFHGRLNNKLKREFARLSRGERDRMAFLQAWESIVELYTSLSLTKETDKLMALSGITSSLATSTDARYLAGLWSDGLELALLWHCTTYGRRPTVYQAPSWSWASLIGHVWLGSPKEELYERLVMKVLDVWTTPITTLFGPVSNGQLQVRSRLCSARLSHVSSTENSEGHAIRFADGFLDDDYDFIFIDDTESPFYLPADKEVFCFEVTIADTGDAQLEEEDLSLLHARGLLLEPTGTQAQFKRIGMYHALGNFACGLFAKAFEAAKIAPELYEEVEGHHYTISII